MILLITCARLYKDDDSYFFACGVWYGGGKNSTPTHMSKSVTPTPQETNQMKRDMRQIKERDFSSPSSIVFFS
jgi:hypothetical protein